MIGSRARNGQAGAGNLDDELRAVEAEITAVERAGLPLASRQAQLEDEIDQAERFFKAHGLHPGGVDPREIALNFRRALRGAFAMLDQQAGGVLLEAERTRIAETFAAQGAIGFTPEAKAARLTQLRARQRQLRAARELQMRREEQERDDILVPPDGRDGEMYMTTAEALEAIAAGREEGAR